MSDFNRINKHPDTKWVISRRDLPKDRDPALFRITRMDGTVSVQTFSKRKRQTLELLSRTKVFCASPIRISQHVCLLKHEDKIDIFTEIYTERVNGELSKYGIYRLQDKVESLGEGQDVNG